LTADATTSPGFWTRAEFAAEYARLTGRDVSRIGYYVAFGYFKLAVVLEGIHARYRQGKTVGEGFDQEGFAVPLLIARAHEVLTGEPEST
jgi:aminoglycoside phosphotransferase (APT) family kinase protein